MEPINRADENELQQAINNMSGTETVATEPTPIVNGFDAAPTTSTGVTGDLSKVKNMALSDLRPVLEQVEMPAEGKFKIYKEIIEATSDKASIEPAYAAAKAIASDKDRAEALLYIIEIIDKLGA
jgi:hypothetical protein